MSVGRNSWQKAFAKAKKKSNPQSSEGPAPNPQSSEGPGPSQAPGRIDFDPNAKTAPRSVLTRMADRSPGVVPTKSTFARMTGYFPPATPRYNDGFPRPLEGAQDTLPEFLQEEIKAAPPLPRHMQFCGGMSKPYKKK